MRNGTWHPTEEERATLQARVTERMKVVNRGFDTPCWVSNRAMQPNGYTKIGHNGRTFLTHRIAYEAFVGPIDEGLVIDHLCRVRACVNPDHLEAVTTRENLVRGETVTALEVAQTHCHRGHLLDGLNLYMRPDRLGRVCRACGRDRAREARRAA